MNACTCQRSSSYDPKAATQTRAAQTEEAVAAALACRCQRQACVHS
jgi:hypothetical protein